jgi:hypothetical protein
MRVFHFVNHEFGLKDIRERRLKIARIMELNDPFEFLGVELSDKIRRDALRRTKSELAKRFGLLCFTKNWHNPVLWGHYANKHRGLCLGFDLPEQLLERVRYVKSRLPWPDSLDEDFMKQLLLTKFDHWSYEDEYRVYVNLEKSENDLYYANFSKELTLSQVIIGSESSISRSQLADALGDLASSVEVFKARSAFKTFKVVRNMDNSLWT